ncbi:hypothetical protein V5O48_012895 [Marasmius crinis-equi]|uniref:Uncharacterized protein n=1 Tax=Marasmius crinis-equi TaxID=585013 RepID=A0ABR3F1K7_9AGAR
MLRAPTLRSLHYRHDTIDLPTQFHHLAYLRVSSSWSHHGLVDSQHAIEILLRCSHSLRFCALDMRVPREVQIQNGLTIELPHLEHLTIRFKGAGFADNMSLFLGSLLTPKLRELALYVLEPRVNSRQPFNEVSLSFLPLFLQRSQCDTTLRSLSLFIPVDGDIVISWLRVLPALTTLRLVSDVFPLGSTYAYDRGQSPDLESVYTVTRRFLEALTLTDEILCPDLKHIEFKDCDPRLVDAFLAFAETRERTLRKCYVDCWRPLPLPEEELSRKLRVLREGGMDIVWRSQPAPEFIGRVMQDGPRDGLEDIVGEEFLFPYLEDRSRLTTLY